MKDRAVPSRFDAPLGRAEGLIDPAALMKIKSMELRAKAVVEGFWKGIHRSPYHGFSVEFTEYRQYAFGDDPRYIDWRVYARSDRFYIKKFEDETNLHCHLLIDHSRSMGYGSGGYTKSHYAGTLAATLWRSAASRTLLPGASLVHRGRKKALRRAVFFPLSMCGEGAPERGAGAPLVGMRP